MRKLLVLLLAVAIGCEKHEHSEEELAMSKPDVVVDACADASSAKGISGVDRSLNFPQQYNVQWQFRPLVREFVNICREKGIDVGFLNNRNYPIQIVMDEMGGTDGGMVFGLAQGTGDDTFVDIRIDPDAWRLNTAASNRHLLFHELAHDVFNADHNGNALMHPDNYQFLDPRYWFNNNHAHKTLRWFLDDYKSGENDKGHFKTSCFPSLKLDKHNRIVPNKLYPKKMYKVLSIDGAGRVRVSHNGAKVLHTPTSFRQGMRANWMTRDLTDTNFSHLRCKYNKFEYIGTIGWVGGDYFFLYNKEGARITDHTFLPLVGSYIWLPL